MQKIIISAFIMALLSFTACNSNNTKTTGNAEEQSAAQFSCSMHPEIIGNKGDKCSKCGMELTEPVAAKAEEHNHNDGEHQQANSTNADPKTSTTTASTTQVKSQATQPSTTTTASTTQVKSQATQPSTTTTAPTTQVKSQATQPSTTTTAPTTVKATFSITEIVSNYLILKNALTKDNSQATASAGKALYTSFAKVNINAMNTNQKKEYTDIANDAKEHAEHIGDNGGKIDHQREHFALLSKDVQDLIKAFGTEQKLYQDFCPMYDGGKGAIWISELKEIKNPYYGSQMLSCGSMKKEY
jgi:outer membrane biosynthesis protein TonB